MKDKFYSLGTFFVHLRISEIIKGHRQTHYNCYVVIKLPLTLADEKYSLSIDRKMSFSFTRVLTQVYLSTVYKLFNHSCIEIAECLVKTI